MVQQVSSDLPILQRDKPVIDTLRVKYGVAPGRPFDQSKMTPEDVQTLDLIQNEVKPALNDLTLALDLSNIRAWWNLAQLIYNDDLQDLQQTDDDDHIGDTLKAQEANFPPATKTMVIDVEHSSTRKCPNGDSTRISTNTKRSCRRQRTD